MLNHMTHLRAFAQNANRFGGPLRWLTAALFFFCLGNTAWANPILPFPGDTTLSATICANETYFFNGQVLNNAGTYTAVLEASDGSDSTVTLVLAVLPLPEGSVTATICQGEVYEFNGEVYSQPGNYSVTLTGAGANGCDSIVRLKLNVLPVAITKINAGICEGTGYLFQGDVLTESGQYSVILTGSAGCDSIVQLQLNVVSFFNTPRSASICKGETFAFDGNLLSDAGVYVDSLKAIGGCDSIVTLTLTVLPVPETTLSVGICEGTSYLFQGDLFSISGQYTYTFTAANGCDSLVTLDLNVVSLFETTAEVSICDGETYGFGTEELTEAGVYTNTFIAIGGCDSIVTLTLTVLPTQMVAIQKSICDGESFEYAGTLLTDPGLYQYVFTGANGCDSTVMLTLTVLEVPNTVIEASICDGNAYELNGETYTEEGVYEQTFSAANGCDSIVSLVLIVRPLSESQLAVTLCNGETYDFNGVILEESGVYSQALPGFNGCDSTVTLTLNVLPVLEATLNVSICAGEAYEFDGNVLVDAGTYTAVFAGTNDCDSTVTLNLEVLPTQSTSLEATICAGETYTFGDSLLTDAGTYSEVFEGINGCDSTVTLVLNVLPTQSTTIPVSICAGEGYPYQGQLLVDEGAYTFELTGANGCDSTVTIQLSLLPISTTSIVATICAGAAYDYNGELLTEQGAYEFPYVAANGCDSIVTVSLTVLPVSTTNLSVTQCAGSSYSFNGQILSDSGIYTAVETAANGCDSTIILQLNFVMEFVTELEASICAGETYNFNGEILNDSGLYTNTFSAAGGCDSLVTLSLTVLSPNQSNVSVTICAGETYAFNGDILSDSGIYTATLTGANGCDSVVVLNLNILPTQSSALDVTTCANQPYAFNGLSLGQSGNYTAVLTSVNGCDSTVTLHLTVLPIVSTNANTTICDGETLVFNGQDLTETGTYSGTFEAANGCDSLVTLQLTVLPLAQSGTAAIVCEGQPYEFNGEVLTQSGTYMFNFPGAGANGCDSVVTLYLTIFPLIPPTNLTETICSGEVYMFDGQVLTTSGTYTAELASATGCDSLVVLQLTVLQSSSTTINASICQGGSYSFEGQTLTDPGTYTVSYNNVNGCDSNILLILQVIVVNTNVTVQGGTLTAQATNAQFQWIDCATNQAIAGATSSSFTPTVSGMYAVIVTDAIGCTGQSDCKTVQVVSVGEPWSQADWRLQPNPATQTAVVMLSEALEADLQVEIYDAAGRLLRQLNTGAGTLQIELDLTDLPEGMLLVRLASERGTTAKLLMKAGE